MQKFEQNQHLMDTLIEKTGSKKIVECANDRLWGNRVNLNHDDCLNSEKWISPGILGKILEGIRDSNMQNRLTDSAVPSENMVTKQLRSCRQKMSQSMKPPQ